MNQKYTVQKLIQEKDDWKKEDFVFFWGHRKGKKIGETCLSQWYEIEFEVDGHKYNCAEQYMMAQKAWLFKDIEIFSKILDNRDPKEIKALGREVKDFDSKIWNQHKFEIVVKGNLAKFGQNPELMEFLLSLGDKILVEASPYDKIWGIGMKEGTLGIENPSNWKGENLLGFALMEVRDELIIKNRNGALLTSDNKGYNFGSPETSVPKMTSEVRRLPFLKLKKIMIIVRNKRCSQEKLLKEFPGAIIIDVTSKGEGEWQKLSPFYPHGGIPVPFSDGVTSMSVEGVWQGLKVFETRDVDWNSFRNGTMKGIKRTVRTNGKCLGHRKGINGKELLGYIDARKEIYVPTYIWILKNKCEEQIKKLRIMSQSKPVILLDYDTNADLEDPKKPLSHASLICRYIENQK